MKTFILGIGTAIVLAALAGFALNAVQISSASFNSTENVRF